MTKRLSEFFAVVLLSFIATGPAQAQQPKSLFYMTRDPKSERSFLAHADKIDLLSPGWYSMDASGLLSGGPNPLVLETARQHHVAVMPLVVNAGFVQEDVHKLLANTSARQEMFGALIRACKDNGYIGFQLDFENVNWTDRDALSSWVREAAAAFHKENLQFSIATIPNAPGFPGETGFSAWIFENWRGAYDLKAIAQSVDFLCLMTYDQHTRWTAPGPVAGWAWTVSNLDYALKVVPREKILLGIPLYGYHWYAGTPVKAGPDKGGDKPNPTANYISTDDALDLAKAYGGHLEWDAADRTAWFYFYRADEREWIFYTDARTFRERYNLVKDRGLDGFASWVLGTEDAGIWDLLPEHK
jgi:spore germination protein YaaH